MKNETQAIFIDFHGTISNYTFWSSLAEEEYLKIQRCLFLKNGPLVNSWMCGRVTTDDVIAFVSKSSGISEVKLSEVIMTELRAGIVEESMLDALKAVSALCPVFLFSDNMSVIASWFRENEISMHFTKAWFSSDRGHLKNQLGGRAYAQTCSDYNLDINRCLFLDDSASSIRTFSKLGGRSIQVESPAHSEVILRNSFIAHSSSLLAV